MPDSFVTYSVEDPRLESPTQTRYVGITADFRRRVKEHNELRDSNTRDFIQELYALNYVPIYRRLELTESRADARASERRWIRHFLDLGCQLLNRNYATEPGTYAGTRGRRLSKDRIRLYVVERLRTGRWNEDLSAGQVLYFEKIYIAREGPKHRQAREWLRETENEP